MNNIDFDYNAFISYSHKDNNWAKWLQLRLESFSSKKFSKKRHPLREIFLDSYNLPISDLMEKGLPENLQTSKYLICICSKHYNSKWTEFEIAEFKRNCEKRNVDWKDYVIPVCLGKDKSMLPLSLKGIKSVNIEGIFHFLQQEYAIALIASKILNIYNPNLIYNYLKKILHAKIISLSLVLIGLLSLGLFVWEFNRIQTVYYADYIEGKYIDGQSSEWIEGIGKIPSECLDTTRECFRFEYKRIPFGEPMSGKWQLQRVVHQDAWGQPMDFEERTTPFTRYPILRICYIYRDSLYLPERIECYDKTDNLQRVKLISGEKLDKIDFKNFKTELSFNEQTLSEFNDPLLNLLGNKYCNITHFDLSRNESGNVDMIVFKASNEKNASPMPNSRKHIGMYLHRDSIGRIDQVKYITHHSFPDYCVDYSYIGYNLLQKTLFLIKDKELYKSLQIINYSYTKDKVTKESLSLRDSIGELFEYLYRNGVLNQKRTYKIKLLAHSAKNNLMSIEREFVEDVEYIYSKKGHVICELYNNGIQQYLKVFHYNKDNQISQIRYLSKKPNEYIIGPEGFNSMNISYNDRLVKSQHVFMGNKDFHIYYEYNSDRQLISISYMDSSYHLKNLGDFSRTVACDDYEASVLNEITTMIDMKGDSTKSMIIGDTIYFLEWKFPFWDNYAKREFKYDEWGNIVKIQYYNEDNLCYVVLDEAILENGTVPLSIGYIMNQKGQKCPLSSTMLTTSRNPYLPDEPFIDLIMNNFTIPD